MPDALARRSALSQNTVRYSKCLADFEQAQRVLNKAKEFLSVAERELVGSFFQCSDNGDVDSTFAIEATGSTWGPAIFLVEVEDGLIKSFRHIEVVTHG